MAHVAAAIGGGQQKSLAHPNGWLRCTLQTRANRLVCSRARPCATLDELGCIFIDRSHEHFPAVAIPAYRSLGGSRAALDEARFYGIEVTELKSVTDEYLRSLVDAAKLDAMAPLKEGIAAFLGDLAPLLSGGAANLVLCRIGPSWVWTSCPQRRNLNH